MLAVDSECEAKEPVVRGPVIDFSQSTQDVELLDQDVVDDADLKEGQVISLIGRRHVMQRQHLVDRHQFLLKKLMKQNAHKSKYWIMGSVASRRKVKTRKTVLKPSLRVLDELPELQKESYLYEIDNEAGTKTLLWVMHPNNKLSLPTIGKSISVAG